MKTILTLALLIIVFPLQSQTNRIYSVSLNGGVFIPAENLSGSLNTGYNVGIDLETRKSNFGIFLGSKLNLVKYKSVTYTMENEPIPELKTLTISEFTAGIRWFWGHPKFLHTNIDLGLGIYAGNFYQKVNWGIQPGLGGNLPINSKISANINLRVNILEVKDEIINKWETYWGMYLGIKYSF